MPLWLGNGKMYQTRIMDVLRLNRPHCMAMHNQLGMPPTHCSGGYAMPATFDLLMDASGRAATDLRGRLEFTPWFYGGPVELG